MISQQTIDEIFETVRIEDVVGDFVNLKRAGRNYKGLCPFHDEKTPSFSVSPSMNIYKCFGCQKAGNAVQFVMEHEKVSYPEALRYLAKKYGVDIEEDQVSDERKEELHHIDSLYILNQYVSSFYESQLWDEDLGRAIGLSYFKQRGFTANTLKSFGIGYAAADGKSLHKALEQNAYNLDYAKEVGVITLYNKDFFRDRVIFPIHNLSGKVIAFAGRTLKKAKDIPKYINSPESIIYEKRKTLYGMYQAKSAIRKENKCILVEGYTDVMSLHQAGIEHAVASSGTALTKEQIHLIRRFADQVIVLYDGDAAGIAAAVRGLRMILAEGLEVKVVFLPTGEDPDSFVQHQGKDACLSYITEKQKDFIVWQIDQIEKDTSSDPIARAKAIKTIVYTLAHVPDIITRNSYVQFTAQRLQLSEKILIEELAKALRQRQKEVEREQRIVARRNTQPTQDTQDRITADPDTTQSVSPSHSDIRERDLIRILLQHGHKVMEQTEDGDDLYVADYIFGTLEDIRNIIDDPRHKIIIEEYYESVTSGQIPSIQHFIQHEEAEVQQLCIDLITNPYTYSHNWEEKLNSPLRTQKMPEENVQQDTFLVIQHFRQKQIEHLIHQNNERLKEAYREENEEKIDRYLSVHKRLIDIRKEINEAIKRVVL